MEKFFAKGDLYQDFHQQPLSFYTHLAGLSLFFISIMIFLNFFHLIVPGILDTTLAELGTIALLFYYIRLNWQIGLTLVPFFALFLWLSHFVGYHGPSHFALWTAGILFLAGLILPLIAYIATGNRLTMMNLRRLFLAPMFLSAEVCYKLGFLRNLNARLHGMDESLESANQNDLI